MIALSLFWCAWLRCFASAFASLKLSKKPRSLSATRKPAPASPCSSACHSISVKSAFVAMGRVSLPAGARQSPRLDDAAASAVRNAPLRTSRSATHRRQGMSDNDLEIGPVDYLIVEWPPGKEPTGEGLDQIVSLS